jgi:hypothetical protein
VATPQKSRKAYLIQESGWSYSDEYYYRGGSADDEVIKAYRTREKAEAFRLTQEDLAREGKNPFEWGSFWSTSLSEEQFLQLVEELGLPAPPYEFNCYQWMNWWAEHEDQMTSEQIQRIWEAMDLLHFFEVVEIELEG